MPVLDLVCVLTRDNDGLVLVVPLHELESFLGHGVDMGVQVAHVLATVGKYGVIVVDVELLQIKANFHGEFSTEIFVEILFFNS